MQDAEQVVGILIACLVFGVLSQVLGGILRLPSILFLLAIGMLLGPDAAGVIDPGRLGPALETLVRLGIAVILFEGAMALRLADLRKVRGSVQKLVTLGVFLTFALAAGAASLIAGLSIEQAAIFGALVSVTGPTVIRPILQRVRVRREVAAILEGEAIIADPIGAIVAALCLEYALAPGSTLLAQVQEFGVRLAVGGGVGAVAGFLAGLVMRLRMPSSEGIKPLIVLACALGGYGASEHFRGESGLMASVAAGLAVQWGLKPYDRPLREFKELITTLILSTLFVLLAANLRFFRMEAEGLAGLATVLIVMLVIRPINVFVCTRGESITRREKIFLSWVAPRGIVAASIASLGAFAMERAGQSAAEAHRVESLVFTTVLLTVFLQGATAQLAAWALGVTRKQAQTILVVGANELARMIASYWHREGRRVTLVDRNPQRVAAAVQSGLNAVTGDATERAVLESAGIREADSVVGLTESTPVNQMAAQLAMHDYGIEHAWVGLDAGRRQSMDTMMIRRGARFAFGRAISFDRWLADLESGAARLIELRVTTLNAPKKSLGALTFFDNVLPVFVMTGTRLDLVDQETRPIPGDRLIVLSTAPEESLKEGLGLFPAEQAPASPPRSPA